MGWDNISTKVSKSFKDIIVSPLTYVCNLAFLNAIFSPAFKKALIIPIYKSGQYIFESSTKDYELETNCISKNKNYYVFIIIRLLTRFLYHF